MILFINFVRFNNKYVMNLERFLNHIYYSFSSLERFFSLSSDGRNHTTMADFLMSFCWVGFVTAVLFLILFFPAQVFKITIPHTQGILKIILPITIGVSLAFFLGRFFDPQIYDKYYDEFISETNGHLTWQIVAYLLLIGSGISVMVSIYYFSQWNLI